MNSDPIHRAKHHQLWIDKVRSELDESTPSAEIHRGLKAEVLVQLSGGTDAARRKVQALSPEHLEFEFVKHDLADDLPDTALRALKLQGWPDRDMTPSDWPPCQIKVDCALGWLANDILRGPTTQVMLLDDRTAKAVADSHNEPITLAELQHLPHNPCLVEFYRPIEIAEKIKRGLRVRSVAFGSLSDDVTALAAVICFYLDQWITLPQTGTRFPGKICVWFGGFVRGTMDIAVAKQIGIEIGSPMQASITEECKRVARNLWDFVTMRSINYDRIKRKPAKHPLRADRPQHIQGLHSPLAREVFRLYLTHDAELSESGDTRSPASPLAFRTPVPGKFHHHVYCASCGDQHRHDLLGSPCRQCGKIVGPRTNVRVEKYWHHPYLMGPEGAPIKEVVRDVHRKKPRK